MPNELDWTHLPCGVETIDLWDWLHDAMLEECESDPLARTLTLQIDSAHIRKHRELEKETRFVLMFRGVTSVRGVRSLIWPGEYVPPDGISREDDSDVAEYQAMWRSESVSWPDVEERIAKGGLDISGASLARGDEQVAIELGGQNKAAPDGYATWLEIQIAAQALEVGLTSGESLTVDEALQWGETFWDELSKRAPVSG